jgi:hypothetical protein
MIRATLSTLTYDPLGSVEIALRSTTRWGRSERRVNRVRTLDGGYALTDFGHADCDRDIQLQWTADLEINTRVDYLVRYYGQLYLSSPHGFWLVAPRGLEDRSNVMLLDLYVLDKLA